MVYYVPQPHKCPKCGHEQMFSKSERHNAPVLSTDEPSCPKCFDDFIRENVAVMQPVQGFHHERL